LKERSFVPRDYKKEFIGNIDGFDNDVVTHFFRISCMTRRKQQFCGFDFHHNPTKNQDACVSAPCERPRR